MGKCRSMNQDNFICDGKYMDEVEIDKIDSGNIDSSGDSVGGVLLTICFVREYLR